MQQEIGKNILVSLIIAFELVAVYSPFIKRILDIGNQYVSKQS